MNSSPDRRLEDDLHLAHALADKVDQLTLDRFRAQDLTVESKADLTPVTDADKSAEELIRSQLSHLRSRDSIIGEEEGASGNSARKWIIDPIDGTASYLRGVPVWATLIALMEEDQVVMSTVSAPALGRRWWALRGKGAWTGRSMSAARPLRVSRVDDIKEASLSFSDLEGWAELGRLRGFLQLAQATWRLRAYGDFWSYMLVAEGAVDIATEPELSIWDVAALEPIVVEAGGRFTSIDGTAGIGGPGALATNGKIHEKVLEYLQKSDF